MSFHSTLTATAVWPTDLIAVVGTLLTSTDQVLVGRQPPPLGGSGLVPSSKGYAFVEYQGRASVGLGFQKVYQHTYLVHLYAAATNRGATGAGGQQLTELETAADEIVNAYHGGSRMRSSLATLLCTTAELESLDADPGDPTRAEATVRVVFTEAPA